MAGAEMSDDEIREDRWEQLNGDVMYWEYGALPKEGPFHADAVHEEARDFDRALEALLGLIGEAADEAVKRALDHPGSEGESARWEVFAEPVEQLAGDHPRKPISQAGPDGWTFWLGEIER